MIQASPWPGAVFTLASAGDQRHGENRQVVSSRLGISGEWATVRQVHGNRVVEVTTPGPAPVEADGLFTKTPGLPISVLTADCAAVVMGGDGGVGVAHAGWRGMTAGVVSALKEKMQSSGIVLDWAAVGPFIGPCCFEVGPEVAAQFPNQISRTQQGTTSVDLGEAAEEQLGGLPVWWSGKCTMHQPGCFSYRRDRTAQRVAALGWIPS